MSSTSFHCVNGSGLVNHDAAQLCYCQESVYDNPGLDGPSLTCTSVMRAFLLLLDLHVMLQIQECDQDWESCLLVVGRSQGSVHR